MGGLITHPIFFNSKFNNMIKDNLNSLIMESMKAGDKVRTNALRSIKTGIMQWETAEQNVGKTLDENTEINIIRKLKNQYIDAAEQCNDGKHDELVKENTALANIMEEFLPAPVTEQTIQDFIDGHFTSDFLVKKNMGNIIKTIKGFYPGADGKMVSQIVMKNLN